MLSRNNTWTYLSTGRPASCHSLTLTGSPRVEESENTSDTGILFSLHSSYQSLKQSWKEEGGNTLKMTTLEDDGKHMGPTFLETSSILTSCHSIDPDRKPHHRQPSTVFNTCITNKAFMQLTENRSTIDQLIPTTGSPPLMRRKTGFYIWNCFQKANTTKKINIREEIKKNQAILLQMAKWQF